MTDNAGRTCLHVAASSGHYDMVQVLIGQGADLNVADKVFKFEFELNEETKQWDQIMLPKEGLQCKQCKFYMNYAPQKLQV